MGVGNGPWYIDDTLTFTVVTHRFDTGALTDADAVPAYRIYEDETGTAILTGNTAKLDDTNTTGFYSEQITLSAANGFEVGKSYSIYVTAAVNSVTGGQTFNFKVIAATPTNFASLSIDGSGRVDVIKVAGTTQTAGDIIGDTNDIQARLPAALVSGRIDASVGAMAANTVTATAIQNDAITAAKIADGAIDAATFAAGAITATAIATDAIDADAMADGAITAATFAAGAIDATAIAANAIGASELAADAVAEIADQVWEEALADHSGTAGSTAAALNAAGSAGDPWATALPGAYGAGTAGKIIGDNINATISSRASQTSVDTVDDFLDTEIAAIKAKTDQLTFTVANQVDSNIESVNGTTVTGSGTAGDPWGP